MARAPKVLPAEVESVEPADATEAPVEPVVSIPPAPEGDPLTWTVEQWLAAADFPLQKVRDELAAKAAGHGVAGVPFAFALSLVQNHANPAILTRAFALVAQGLVGVVTTGKGPVGHSGSDLVG